VARVPRKLTIAEAAKLTGLSRKALARRIERGGLPATTENGLRYLDSRDLAHAGLLDLTTGKPALWAGRRVDPDAVARELLRTLIDQGIEISELCDELESFRDESRTDDEMIRSKIKQMDADRAELRRELNRANRERAVLRRQIEQKPNRRRES
jgi:DNA-binding transcriptional MerR regulator